MVERGSGARDRDKAAQEMWADQGVKEERQRASGRVACPISDSEEEQLEKREPKVSSARAHGAPVQTACRPQGKRTLRVAENGGG